MRWTRFRNSAYTLVAAGAMLVASVCLPVEQAAASGGLLAASVTKVSGPTLLTNCHPIPTNYSPSPNYEVEPFALGMPGTDNTNVFWQQDVSYPLHGAPGSESARIIGPAALSQTTLPFTPCTGTSGPYNWAGDNTGGVSAGKVHSIAIGIQVGQDSQGNPYLIRRALLDSVSNDQGKTWQPPTEITVSTDPASHFADRDTATTDPKTGKIYLAWEDVQHLPNGNFSGPAQLAVWNGSSWSQPRTIVPTGPNEATFANVIKVRYVGGQPVLYNFYTLYKASQPTLDVDFVTSGDGGTTWSKPHTAATLNPGYGVTGPAGQYIYTQDQVTSEDISPTNGDITIAWQDGGQAASGTPVVVSTTSHDGGATWSTVRRVTASSNVQEFTPTVAYTASGVLGISYYSASGAPTGTMPTQYLFRASRDGASFSDPLQLAGDFPLLGTTVANGYLGDYMSMTRLGLDPNGLGAAFVTATNDPNNPTDVYYARIEALLP